MFISAAIPMSQSAPGPARQPERPRRHLLGRLAPAVLAVLACGLAAPESVFGATGAPPPVGDKWTVRASAADNSWNAVTHGEGIFVAVASNGAGNRVMTSGDGINWTTRASAADNAWSSVAYGHGRFVAVASSGVGNRVMTSEDGLAWTTRASAADNAWRSVAFGGGVFVAVASSGAGNRVMTSEDGITWTTRSTAGFDNSWNSVAFGGVDGAQRFVAVGGGPGVGNRVMTSEDGIAWTARASAADNTWYAVAYGSGVFAAVAGTGSGNRVMTSPDGIDWTPRNTVGRDHNWLGVHHGNGRFVAVASGGMGNRVMTSPDGVIWTQRSTVGAENNWWGITYAEGLFVATGYSGSGNRVMTSNDAFVNQVLSPADNRTPTDVVQLVPASGTTPSKYVVYNSTAARVAAGRRWGIWGYDWADTTLTLANSNTIPISLATYQNAGSCTPLGMPATNCPRPVGVLKAGQSMPFRAAYKVDATWAYTPVVTLTRPGPSQG